MAISMTLQEYLKDKGVNFDLEHHRHTYNSASTAEAMPPSTYTAPTSASRPSASTESRS